MRKEIRISSTNGRRGFLISYPEGTQFPVKGTFEVRKSGSFDLIVVTPDPNAETWVNYFDRGRFDGGFKLVVPFLPGERVVTYDLQSHSMGGVYMLRTGAIVKISGYKERWTSYCVMQEDGSLKEVTIEAVETEKARREAILKEIAARENREVTPRLRILKSDAHGRADTVFYGDFASAFQPTASDVTAPKMTGDVVYAVSISLFAALPHRWDMVCSENGRTYITRPNLTKLQKAIIAAAFENYNQPYALTTVVMRGDELIEVKKAQAIELPPVGEPTGSLREYLTDGNYVSAALLHERLLKAGYMLAYTETVTLENESKRHVLAYVSTADVDKIGIWGNRFINASLEFRVGVCPGEQFFFFVLKHEEGKTVWVNDRTYPKASVPPEVEEVSPVAQKNAITAVNLPQTPWLKAPVVTRKSCKNVNAELARIFGAVSYGRFKLVERPTGDFGFIECGSESFFVAPGTLGDLRNGETALVLKAERSRYADRKPQAVEHMAITPQMAEAFIP
jgi:hypothetical protein